MPVAGTQATKRRRSSVAELPPSTASTHSAAKKAKSATHVSGSECRQLCLGPLNHHRRACSALETQRSATARSIQVAMITSLAISGYRSLREVRVTLSALNVVTGANGSGKSSLYRALKLLADIAQGQIIQSLAAEGGLESTLCAGPEAFSRAMKADTQPVQGLVRKNPISLKLGFSGDDYGYAIDLGLPRDSIFLNDPAIKVESLWTGERLG